MKIIPLIIAAVVSTSAWCQPLSVIIGAPVGSASDVITRVVLERAEARLNRRSIIENRSAGFSSPALDIIKQAKPDGNTMLVTVAPNLLINKIVRGTANQPITNDVTPITIFALTSNILVVNSKLNLNSLDDLIKYAKSHDAIPYASLGNGTTQHILAEMMQQRLGVSLTHIPYKSAGQVLIDLLSGQVPLTTQPAPLVIDHIRSTKLKALAITGPERLRILPDTVTTGELGFPDLISVSEYSMHFPSGTPSDLVWSMYKVIAASVAEPLVRERLETMGTVPRQMPPDKLTRYLDDDIIKLSQFLKQHNITIIQ